MTVHASARLRYVAMISLAWNTIVIASTLPIGGHYTIDLVGGTLLWLAATQAEVPGAPSLRGDDDRARIPDWNTKFQQVLEFTGAPLRTKPRTHTQLKLLTIFPNEYRGARR